MQSLNLFLTKSYIFFSSTDLPLDNTQIEFDTQDSDPFDTLSELLEKLDLPRNINLNLILDQGFVNYCYFTIPPISRRKIDKVLGFELADTLVSDADDYLFDYNTKTIKDLKTQIGVYTIDNDLIGNILQIGKSKGLDIKSVLSLNDLLDIRLREAYSPDNHLIITADQYQIKLFVYNNGFLKGCSSLRLLRNGQLAPLSSDDCSALLQRLNSSIKSILLKEYQIEKIVIDKNLQSVFSLNEESELEAIPQFQQELPSSVCEELTQRSLTARSNRLNLLKSNVFRFQELKKHSKKLAVSLVTLILAFGVYITSLVYENNQRSDQYKNLQSIYATTLKKYLPRGATPSNGIQVLQEKVNELKQLKRKNERFTIRDYRISDQLNQLSALKQKIPSLIIDRYFMTDQSIRVQGEVASFDEYDRLKANLLLIYPEQQYSVRFNQKSVGDDIIQFSATVRESK